VVGTPPPPPSPPALPCASGGAYTYTVKSINLERAAPIEWYTRGA
jgi:hypothetical protein